MIDVRSLGVRIHLRGIVAAVSALSATVSMAVDITDCNQVVPPRATAHMVSDLDCSLPYGSYAVVLSQGARLRLNGFTLRSNANGVSCLGKCRVTGPGEIARSEPSCS